MDRENYYILLELPFDPPENDENKIKAAISKKRQQWSKEQVIASKKVKAGKYLGMLDDIQKLMSDPAARKAEAAAAKKLSGEKIAELDQKIKISSAKGFIKPTEIKQWAKQFAGYGITEELIKKRVKVPIDTKPPQKQQEEKYEVIDSSKVRNIDTNLKSLNMAGKTLYEFMEMPASSTPDALVERAESKKKMLLAKGDKTPEDNARQSLYGICVVVFKDKNEKKKYDNYVEATKYYELNLLIDEGAAGNNKTIEAATYEVLLDSAVSHGLSVSDAGMYIKRYCKIKGYVVAGGAKITCGLCKTENPAGSITCSKCGKPLIVTCPKCGAENGNADPKCAGCGFNLSRMNEALPIIDNAKEAFKAKKISDAKRLLETANTLWPKHPDIIALQEQIATQEREFSDIIAKISEDINAKKFYAAQVKISQAKANGFDVDSSVVTKVADEIKQTEAAIEKIKTMSSNDAFTLIMSLVEKIKDSNELNAMVKKYPPDPAKSLSAELHNGNVIIKWTPTDSVGEIKYILVRKKDGYPNDSTDGDMLYTGTDTQFNDDTITSGTEYFYAVFVERIGICSIGTRCNKSVIMVSAVNGAKALGGDGLATLSWNKGRTVTEIRLWIYEGDSRPESVDVCNPIQCNRLEGMNVNSLQNGTKYWFGIQAVHTINSKNYTAEAVFINVVPQKPATPLQGLQINKNGGIYNAKWEVSEWDVVLLRSEDAPDYACGTIYDFNELLQKYKKIDMTLKSNTEAEFILDFVGECYIIPCVVNASNAILNTAVYLSSVDDVSQLGFDTNAAGTELYVNFKWPKGIKKVVMVYRMDKYPDSVDDAAANCIECTRPQYDANDALLINNPAQGTYYVLICSMFESGEKKVYSSGQQLLINNEPQRDLYYEFKYKKPLFSAKRTLTLEIKSAGNFMLPQFVLVSKIRSVPLTRADGDVICSVSEETEIKGSHTFTFEVRDLPKDTYIKMFFINKNHYKRYKLLNSSSSKV